MGASKLRVEGELAALLDVVRALAVGLEPGVEQQQLGAFGGDRVGLVLGAGVLGEVEPQVAMGDLVGIADRLDVAAVEQHRPVAELLDRAHVVGDQDHRAVGAHLVEDVAALLLEGGVADREHLVDQQDVGVGLDHHRERQPHEHPRGVVLQLQLGELLELGELDHRVEPRLGLARAGGPSSRR